MDGISVFGVAGLFFLFLFLWFYRRFELKRIKKKYDSDIRAPKPEIIREINNAHLQHQSAESANFNGCLTGNSDQRNCFFIEEGRIPDENGVDYYHVTDALKLLLPKINQTVFCEHACRRNDSCDQEFKKQIPLIIYNKNLHELESLWDFFLNPRGNKEELINGKRISEDSGHPVNPQPSVQPSDLAGSLKEEDFLRQVFHLIQDNFTDYRYSVENLSLGLNMSVSQVNRKLNTLTGYPAGHFIRSFRLGKAALMLIRKTGSITDICFKCGFNELGYFSRAFKKQFGCSPTVYKKLMTKKSEYHAFIG